MGELAGMPESRLAVLPGASTSPARGRAARSADWLLAMIGRCSTRRRRRSGDRPRRTHACARDGNEISLLGSDVWQVRAGRECEGAVRWALEAGTATSTRRRRTATRRASAAPCATAACRARRCSSRRSSIRSETTPRRRSAQPGAPRRQAGRSGHLHWPQGGPTWAWDGMQRALSSRVRSLDRRRTSSRAATTSVPGSASKTRSPRCTSGSAA
jgi:hypothetical protein